MLRTKPKDYYAAYKKVLETQPAQNTFIAFVAFLLGDFDVLASVVSESQKSVKEFVIKNFANIEGVEEVKIFPIKRSKLLISSEEWQMFQRALLYAPSWMTDEIKDTFAFGSYLTDEDIHLSGAMRSES
jgi:predicted methyltransferase